MKNSEIDHWECAYCGFKIDPASDEHLKYDVDCRCKKCSVSEYIPKYKKRTKHETRDH